MLALGGDFYLFGKALRTEHGGEFGSQDFDSDFALVLQILSEVYVRHATLAEFALDPVAVGQGCREAGGDLGHRAKIEARTPCGHTTDGESNVDGQSTALR